MSTLTIASERLYVVGFRLTFLSEHKGSAVNS